MRGLRRIPNRTRHWRGLCNWDDLDEQAFRQSRNDPTLEYHGTEKEFPVLTGRFVPCKESELDEEAELAWRHVTYDPPQVQTKN
jgi:hypothetical protein